MIKKGTKFVVCGHKELVKKGWKLYTGNYTHKNYGVGGIITFDMIENYQEQVLTVTEESKLWPEWYWVDQNPCLWPVAAFYTYIIDRIILSEHLDVCLYFCTEGMTPIDGWIICKNCGRNLKEIK